MIISRKGNPLMSVGGYTFCKKFISTNKTRWVCSTHNYKKCRASAITVDDVVVKINNHHNHSAMKHGYP